jgi:hypothetical protein
MTAPAQKYHYTRYNQYDVLRLNWAYWTITLFLSRHLILLMLIGVSAGKTGGGPRNPALAALLDPVYFVSDLPALFLLFVAGARLPKSGGSTRFLWRQGRTILLSSSALYIGLLFWQQGFDVAGFQPVTWGLIALNLAVMAYVMKSAYLRDLFSEFPDPDSDPNK